MHSNDFFFFFLQMGFLRQQSDGSTSLAILIPSSGDPDNPTEKPISLGQLIGKLSHGSGQLQGMREDRRNFAKTGKCLILVSYHIRIVY